MQRDLFEPLNDYYVTVVRDRKCGFLAGPFRTHRQALEMVSEARRVAQDVDAWTSFDLFGTSSLKRTAGNPRGKLNARLGLTETAGKAALSQPSRI